MSDSFGADGGESKKDERARLLSEALDIVISVEEKFDDNIFETYDVKKISDFITTISPKVSLKIDPNVLKGIFSKGEKNRKEKTGFTPEARLSLESDIKYYLRHTELNETGTGGTGDYFEPLFSFEAKPWENLSLYYKTSIKRENATGIDPLGSSREKKKVDTSSSAYGASYEFGPGSQKWLLKWDHTTQEYKDDYKPFGRGIDKWSVTTTRDLSEKRLPAIFAEYEGEASERLEGAKNRKTTHGFFLGLDGKFSPRISGAAKAGYGLAFNEGATKSPTGAPIAELDWKYKVTERFSCGFKIEKTLEDVAYVDFGGDDTGGLNIPQQLKESTEFSVRCDYTPPFFMENLKLGADYSHRELEYTGGGKQKVRELGFTYKYTWKNKNRDTKNERRGFSKISSAWSVEGELRTRITSPNTGWSKLSNNEAYLKLSTEF